MLLLLCNLTGYATKEPTHSFSKTACGLAEKLEDANLKAKIDEALDGLVR